MSTPHISRYFKTSPEIIRLTVMMYIRYPLSLRNVEDLLHDRGIDIIHETVRCWWNRFGAVFAAEISRNRVQAMRHFQHRQWHLDEVFVKIKGVKHYFWRAVDHEGEVLKSFAMKRRDKKAALKFLRKLLRRYDLVETIVTDRLASYGAALKQLGAIDKREVDRWLNNRVENSHQPSDDGSGRCCASDKCEVCRNLPPCTAPFTTTSTTTYAHQSPDFQGSTHRRAGRMASTLHGLSNHGLGRILRLFWFV